MAAVLEDILLVIEVIEALTVAENWARDESLS